MSIPPSRPAREGTLAMRTDACRGETYFISIDHQPQWRGNAAPRNREKM
jgi:hypothetical protein